MRNWKKKFENKFIADDILDCIPLANWEEMGDEVFAFIKEEKRISYNEGVIGTLQSIHNERDLELLRKIFLNEEELGKLRKKGGK